MGLDEAGVGRQQGPHHDLGLGHLMATGAEKMPGDGRRGQGLALSEQEFVGLGPEFLQIVANSWNDYTTSLGGAVNRAPVSTGFGARRRKPPVP